MSKKLSEKTRPPNLIIWAPEGDPFTVLVGSYEIPIEEFMEAVGYVLTNRDLDEDDPRIAFIEDIKSMEQVKGFNEGGMRLIVPNPVFLMEPIILG